MKPVNRSLAVLAVLTWACIFAPPASAADEVAGFYKGKTVRLVIGFSVGGGFDIYGRIVARYIGLHIPGNPTVIPQNMPGAGSLTAANYIYNAAPKDGTVFGIFARGIPMEQLLGRVEGHRYDATKFTWLGSVTNEPSVCGFWSTSAIRSWADMQTKPFTMGGAGVTSDQDVYANVLRNLFHLPGRLVTGFPGGAEVVLAMQRGEVDGRCGWAWSSLQSLDKPFLDKNLIAIPVQLGIEPNPDLPDVPLVMDLTSDPKVKAALRLIFSRQVMARPFAAPPGIPEARANALRAAFDATMKDSDFLAEAERLGLEVRPVPGMKIDLLIRELYSYPADVIKIASDAIKNAP